MKPEKTHLALLALGFTEDEIAAMDALTDAANKLLSLPKLHPMEREETCHDMHKLQLRVLARPGLRAFGWPETDDQEVEGI